MQDGLCVLSVKCPLSSVWNPTTLKCDCTYFGEYVINGFCQPCQLNSAWNGTACACRPGFVADGPLCNCPPNSAWNGATCACTSGFISIADTCAKCDANAVYVSPMQPCVCRPGWFGIYSKCSQCDVSCATCSGPAASDCVTCGPSSRISDGKCVSNSCPSGQYLDGSNNCQSCMSFCANCSNGSSCSSCQNGYSLSLSVSGSNIVSSCQLTPTGASSVLALRGQVVGNGVIYQGISLSLMPTSILASGCSICNSLLTVKVASSFASVTTTVTFV